VSESTAQIEGRITDALDTIRTHWAALLIETSGTGTAGSTDAVTSLDRRISLRHEVTLSLNGWARLIVEERDLTHHLPLGHDTAGLTVFLTRWARWFSGHDAAPDCADELEDWARQVRATAAPQRREWLYLGDCPFVIDTWFCTGQIRAYPEADPHCSECGQEAIVEWWMDVLAVVPTMTSDELPAFVRRETGRAISRVTLWRWLKESVIVPCGVDTEGRPIYDKGAVAYTLALRDGAA